MLRVFGRNKFTARFGNKDTITKQEVRSQGGKNGKTQDFSWNGMQLHRATSTHVGTLWCVVGLQFNSVQSLSRVRLSVTPWTAAHQDSLYITNSWSPLKPMSIVSVMLSNHLILCHPLLLLPSIFPRIRVFSNESTLRIRWPEYWSFSFNISPSTQDWPPLGWTGWISLQSKGLSRVFSNTTVQKHQFFGTQLSL